MNKYFYEVFENIPRQGPGNFESTQKAFKKIIDLPPNAEILDIGCGKGVQTIHLASFCDAQIIAVDNHSYFLDCLKNEADSKGFKNRIECINADMNDLPFNKASFDLIWSEGSIFVIGMKTGLIKWKPFLRNSGYLVFSDLIWLSNERPLELSEYWEKECLYVMDIKESTSLINDLGYKMIDHFTLPKDAWINEYILPLEKTIHNLQLKNIGIKESYDVYNNIVTENNIIRKYYGLFGYEFFILQNIK